VALVHGKLTEITLDGDDLTEYCDTSEFTREADEHDTTTYGSAQTSNAHAMKGGLRKGNGTIGGLYETGATGPGAIIRPLIGTNVVCIRKVEGTGTGKPLETVTVHVKDYKETAPVADYVRWTASLTFDGWVADTTQA
jgi:hypothetical protein